MAVSPSVGGCQSSLSLANAFPILFFAVFVLVFGTVLVTLIRNMGQWSKNNRSPRLAVGATVTVKRTHHLNSATRYYATFEVESGDRFELAINGSDYGLLAEGDQGVLTFQGTRYLGFSRT